MGKVVTFGEILMRLSPRDNRKFQQANQLDYFFGGTEFNVAASLAKFGVPVQYVTNISNDLVGEAAFAYIRQFGIDVSAVGKVDYPLGLYFLEVGSTVRGSKVSYNRLHGSFANINPEEVDWKNILNNCQFFHWTGISPAISEGAYTTLKKGLQMAREKGICVSVDPTYRKNLWRYGKKGREVLTELVALSNIFIGGVEEMNEILGTNFHQEEEGFLEASKELMSQFPGIEKIFDKIRTGKNASWQKISGRGWNGDSYFSTKDFEITHVVDRIGTGDAFSAGILYGLMHFDEQRTLEFASAACALKHSILGDVNLVDVEEVLELVNGLAPGRINR